MINVKYDKPKKLASIQSIFVTFKYKQSIVDAIRTLPERYWDGKNKVWELSYESLSELKKLLPKEEFVIVGSPVNDKKFGEKLIEKHYTLPKGLKTKLYKYQEEDFNELMNFDKYLLLNDQGTGKTLITIALALKRKELGQVKHCLIVCGVNTIKFNWQEEIKLHTGMDSIVLGARKNRNGVWQTKGTQEKLEDLEHLNEFFIITNIESLRNKEIKDKLKKHIDKKEINMILFDELHRARTAGSQQGKSMLSLAKHCQYFYGMTGTVICNNPLDAYVPLKCVENERANLSQFKSRYCEFGGWGNYSVVGYKHLDELQNKLDSVSKRRLKKDVLDLPPKVYTDEYLEMGTKQAKLYSDVLKAIMQDIDNVVLSLDPLGQLIRLRQVTADTSILSNTIKESVKFDRMEEIVEDVVRSGSKVIIFSNWTTVTDRVYKRLLKYNPAMITGKVKDRETQKKKFMEDDSCKVIICTIAAAGVGLTLTAADTAIFLDESWTSASNEQASDRIHRIGQNNSVNVITLICKGTIDEFVHKIVNKKRVLGETLIDHKYDLRNEEVIKYILTGEGELE